MVAFLAEILCEADGWLVFASFPFTVYQPKKLMFRFSVSCVQNIDESEMAVFMTYEWFLQFNIYNIQITDSLMIH